MHCKKLDTIQDKGITIVRYLGCDGNIYSLEITAFNHAVKAGELILD